MKVVVDTNVMVSGLPFGGVPADASHERTQ